MSGVTRCACRERLLAVQFLYIFLLFGLIHEMNRYADKAKLKRKIRNWLAVRRVALNPLYFLNILWEHDRHSVLCHLLMFHIK